MVGAYPDARRSDRMTPDALALRGDPGIQIRFYWNCSGRRQQLGKSLEEKEVQVTKKNPFGRDCKSQQSFGRGVMAEREGFEPPIPVKVWPLSRRLVSTTHAPLRARLPTADVAVAL